MTNKPQFVGEKRRRIRLNELCTKGKSSLRQKDISNGGPYAVYGASGIVGSMDSFQNAVPYVAVVKDGAGVGRTSACAANTSVLGTMQALIPTDGTNRDYLLHLIKSLRLGDDFSGSTIPHIYFKDYGKTLVPFHNPVEQQRIVDILSTVERQIEGSKQQLDQLDSLVKSRFVEMFGTICEPHYPVVEIERLCSCIVDCPHETPKYEGELIHPAIRTSELKGSSIDWSSMRYVSESEYQQRIKRMKPMPGDIVYAREGTYGDAAILPTGYEFCLGQRTMLFRASADVCMPEYLLHALISPDVKRQADELNVGSTVPHVNVRDAKRFKVMCPNLDIQQEFAAFVAQVDKSRFAYIRSQAKSVEQTLSGPSLTLVIQHVEPQTRSKYGADVLASPSWPSVGAALVQKRRTFAF